MATAIAYMTTYQQNIATINGDTCAVSAQARFIGLGCLMGSSERIMRSGIVCDISQRILKTGQGETCDSPSLFALPAKEMRTIKALLPQFNVTFGTYLRTVQNFSENLTAAPVKSQAVFTKHVLGLILGFLNPVLAVSK